MPASLTGRLFLCIILVMNHLAAGITAACSNCPFQWREFRGHCYWMVTERMSFEVAEQYCQTRSRLGRQSHLMSVASAEENVFLRNYTLDILGQGRIAVWIGLNDQAKEDEFVWTDGKGAFYRDFKPGEPSGSNEDCVVLWYVNHWNDIGCEKKFASVCKMSGRYSPRE